MTKTELLGVGGEFNLPAAGTEHLLPAGNQFESKAEEVYIVISSKIDAILKIGESNEQLKSDATALREIVSSFTPEEKDTANLGRFFGKTLRDILTTVVKDRNQPEESSKLELIFGRISKNQDVNKFLEATLKKKTE